jgi:hypothetical protein
MNPCTHQQSYHLPGVACPRRTALLFTNLFYGTALRLKKQDGNQCSQDSSLVTSPPLWWFQYSCWGRNGKVHWSGFERSSNIKYFLLLSFQDEHFLYVPEGQTGDKNVVTTSLLLLSNCWQNVIIITIQLSRSCYCYCPSFATIQLL